MLSLEMVQIKGSFPRTTGWSTWGIKPASPTVTRSQLVTFPTYNCIVVIGDKHFGPRARCTIHEYSEKGYWLNTIVLSIPSGSSPDERQAFVEELEPLTNVRPR
jgi:hypothetical protein